VPDISEEKQRSIRDKVAKLLNLNTQRGATPAEAASALAKANELLEKYNLTMDDVGRESIDETEIISEYVPNLTYEWEMGLHSALAPHNMCMVVFIEYKTKLLIIGRRFNVIAHHLTYMWVYSQLYKQLNAQIKLEKPPNPFLWREAFFNGAAKAIRDRIDEAAHARYGVYPGCRVMVENRLGELMAEFERLFGRGTKKISRTIYSGPGYENGYASGRSVNFGDEPTIEEKKRMLNGCTRERK